MRPNLMAFLLCVSVGLVAAGAAPAASPERLYEHFWSADCAVGVGHETTEYTTFKPDSWCIHYVDDYRVQSKCDKATFEPLGTNRIGANVEGGGRFILEFLWASRISVMRVVGEKPLKLEQSGVLGRAVWREELKTHHLFCP